MDQGSYSRPDGRGQPTLSGTSAGNNNYQVNVSRQKTKKWVEAKSQNYDGDDWGADEYSEDEIEPPLPFSPHGPQYDAPHSASSVPSMHSETSPASQPSQPSQPPQQPRPYPPPSSRPPPPAIAQPRQAPNTSSSAHPSSTLPQSASVVQPQSTSSTYPLSPRSPPDSLSSATSHAAATSKPLVRPLDIYRRMEEERGRGSSESSRPSAELASNVSKQSSDSPARTAAEPMRPQSPNVPAPAPRTDSRNVIYQDLTRPSSSRASQQPPAPSPPQSAASPSQFVTPGRDAAPTNEETKRLSTSPKLPDLARISVFGADFFSTGFSSLSSEQMAEQKIPEVPKVAPALKVDKPTSEAKRSPAGASQASTDKTEVASAASVAMDNASLQHEAIAPTPHQASAVAVENPESKPSTTPAGPKPSDPAKQSATRSSIETASSSRSATSAVEITPTKPLNVRKDDSPVRSFEPPPPLQREPTFGTDTSSPVKESDVLRDEIFKTLNSPTQPSRGDIETGPADGERQGSQSRPRDSTYTLQDYDSYWADDATGAEGSAQPLNSMTIVPEETSEVVAAPRSRGPIANASESWKPTDQAKPAATPPPTQPAASAQPTPQISINQSSASPVVSQAYQSTAAQQPPDDSIASPTSADLRRRFSWEAETSKAQPTGRGVAPPAATDPPPVLAPAPIPDPAPALAATSSPHTDPKPGPEPASPRDQQSGASALNVSTPAFVATDGSSQESKRLSFSDEKAISATTSNEASSEEHPALRLSDPAPAPVLSMPRIPGASVTPFRDIVSLGSSAERIAKFNETRVAFAVMDIGLDKWLRTLDQDYPDRHSKSFNSYQPPITSPTEVSSGAQPPAQQPYYQQYLNASTPGSGPPAGRRIGGITMPSNVGGSTFGHSGNQIGSKSKELMQSAGKMGKGLFSKGKNKLRGDKGDTHPPPAQTKAKHDRSGSWAVLSSKLRTEFSSSRDHEHSQQRPQQRQQEHSAPRPSITIAPQIPVPEPVSPLLREASPDKSLPAAQTSTQPVVHNQFAVGAKSAPTSSISSVPPSGRIRVVPSETVLDPTSVGAPVMSPPVAEDNGVGELAQTDESEDAPKRQSSFVGLPAIRRSSTFAVKSKTRRAAERFPLDEEGVHDVPDLPTSDVRKHALSQQDAPKQLHHEQSGTPEPGAACQTTDKDGTAVHHRPGSAEHSPQQLARQPAMAPPSQPQPMHQPEHPPMLMYPGQSGPWRLEESHLAEPLHQAKNRSGHSPISPPMNYGFEKEIGHPAMMPPPPLPAGNIRPPPPLPAGNIRQRSADVPPSSAQRYPGLFAPHPDQEPLQRQGSSQSYYEEMANPRRSSNEYSIPGVGPPAEERGRAKRNSGIFREFGDKIVRATSRDRRNSIAENRPPTDAHADEASESSFGAEEMQDRKKRRSSFLNMLTGRASMDQGSHQGLPAPQRSQTDALPPSSSEGPSGQKRSVLGGVMAGFGVSKGVSSNAPTSSLADQPPVADDELPLTPKKKRFSGIARAFQRPNQDRPSSGMSLRPSSGLSLRPSSGMSLEPTPSGGSSQGNTRSGIFSSMPFRNKDQGDSAGQVASATPEQNRRASFSNLLSSLAGIKSHQQQQQHAVPVQGMGGNASNEMPRNIPPAPHQIHPADGFPSSARDAPAPTLPNQFVDPPQQLFDAGGTEWGIDRPPTSTTVTASETKPDVGESIASSAATVPATIPVTSELPLPTAHANTQRDEASAPSEISDFETDIAENTRKPSDVTLSIASHTDEESAEITRQDTNVSQMTSSIVTDVPRQDEQQQTPTGQDPKSPGGYLEHKKMSSAAVPSAVPQGYPQQHTVQHQRDPSYSSTGPGYSQGTSQPGFVNYGQDTPQSMQYPKYQQQQQHLQPSLAQPVPQAERAGASPKGWRGLKTKVAGQMASINQSPNSKGQDKQDQGGKTTSMDKLFGARKRLSKQQGLSGAQQQGALTRDGAEGVEPSPGFRVFARNQDQPFVAQPQQLPPQQMHMGQGHQLHQPFLQQQSMYTQQQSPQQQQPQGEPQYAAVPIPQGYTTVYGQGSAQVPSMYNVGRQYSQHQTPYQQQQNYATHYQPQSFAGVNQPQGNGVFATQTQAPHLPQAESLPRQPHSQQPYATGSEVLSPVSTRHSDSMPLSPASDEPRSPHAALTREALAQQDARKDLQADLLRPKESHGGLGPSNSSRVSQISNDSRRHASPKSEQSPVISHKQLPTLPASPSNDRQVSAPSMPPVGSGSDTASLSHGAARTGATIPAAPAAPLVKDLTGESRGQVSDDSLEPKTKLDKTNAATVTAATEHVAELEDTAEARKRTLRINEQEEKIAYDPEEENPKMMATSYPGQEWKPDYGDPGFSDGPE